MFSQLASPLVRISFALAALGGPVAAQEAAPLAAGLRALDGNQLDLARERLLEAFDFAGPRLPILEGLLRVEAAAGDEDARAFWAHEWALAAAGPDGRTPRAPRGMLPDGAPVDLARRRVAAIEELSKLASKKTRASARATHDLWVAAWLRRIGLELAQPMPAVLDAHGEGLDPAVHASRDAHVDVLKSLERAAESSYASGAVGDSIRAARIIHGLAVQADFGGLLGEAPGGMARWRARGAELLRRGRERLLEIDPEHARPWTVEELEWLSSDEGEAFTRRHGSFATPGVAVSPRGWYRVESDCGYETLLGVARTIERHHERLVSYFGVDPFIEEGDARRPGLVRVVPRDDGLEAEGVPHFWAAGFQSGDTTVVRFSVGNIEGLGRTLTHELTHRFDGALHANMPAWLLEGRAEWTARSYGHSTDEQFIENHAETGVMIETRVKGYDQPGRLGLLVAGEPVEYRDNYTAGYALYLFLETWPPSAFEEGEPLFRARLREFEDTGGAAAGKAMRASFLAHFCDGVDGRPADLDDFAKLFGEFLEGFRWRDPEDWVKRYTRKRHSPRLPDWVYDEPTWVWSFERARPTFGQDQARLAGDLLLGLGRGEAAAAAYVWSRSQDGLVPRTNRALAEALKGVSRSSDAAWLTSAELRFPSWPAAEPSPALNELRSTRALLDAYRVAAEEAPGPRSQRALRAEHDRLARWLGAPELGASEPLGGTTDPPAQPLGGFGEALLAGFDEGRRPEFWSELDGSLGGGVLVGRKEGRGGSGRFDNEGGTKAFALASDYLLPGRYRIRARVRFVSAFNEGELVLGYTRRDRCVRLSLTAGSLRFAAGVDDVEPKFDEVTWGLRGGRIRDRGLPGARPRGTFKLGRSKTVVDVELLVDGATVTAYLDGEEVGAYHTIDGAPIEGRVGFASRHGALRIERPTYQRLDRRVHAGDELLRPRGLDLDRPEAPAFGGLANLPLRGLEPSTSGRVVLWIPRPEPGSAADRDPERLASGARQDLDRLSDRALANGVVQPLTAIVPRTLGDDAVAELNRHGADLPAPVSVRTHRLDGPTGDEDAPDRGRRWLFFVDASGVIRVGMPWGSGGSLGAPGMTHWLSVFREHGAPPRDLPPLVREVPEGDE